MRNKNNLNVRLLILSLLTITLLIGLVNATPKVNLTSPGDLTVAGPNPISFNASASVASGSLTNMSWYSNSTGTWLRNQTISIGGGAPTTSVTDGTFGGSDTGTFYGGMAFNSLYTAAVNNWSKDGTSNCNTGYILWANKSVLYTASSLSGNTFIFPANSLINAGTHYFAACDTGGGSWTSRGAGYSYPNASGPITWQAGLRNDNNANQSGSSHVVVNIITTNSTSSSSQSFSKSVNSLIIWNVEACMNNGTCAMNATNYTLLKSPRINVTSPTNTTFLSPVWINATADESVDQWIANYNGTNVTLSSINSTLAMESGSFHLLLYGRSATSGVYGLNSSIYFSVSPYIINSQTYNNVTFETATETYSINLSLGTGVTLNSASLNYNGTSYGASITSSGNYRIVNRSLNIPNVSAQTNVTFFWELSLSSGNVNTSSNTQTINTLALDNCGINTNLILNYTIYDEDTRVFLNNNTYNTSANVFVRLSGDFSGATYEYFSGNVRTNPFQICVSNALITGQNYRLDAEVQYTAADRVIEYNYLQNYTLNTSVSPRNISLYDLLINNSQEFLITFKNGNLIPVEGALIELSRQYLSLGQFLTVEIAKTDTDGKTIGHFVLNDEVYTLYVKKNGVLLATYENVRAFCSDIVTGDCRINLNQASTTSNPAAFTNYLDVIGQEDYNDSTKTYTFDFTTIDSSTKTINVTILKYDSYLNTTICSQVLTSSSGTISCTIPSTYYNSTGIVTVLVDGEEFSQNIFGISVSKQDQLNASRFFLAFLIIITLPLLAYSSGVMVLVMFIVGLVLAIGMALIDSGGFIGPLSAVMWFIAAAIILMIKAAQRREQ